MTTKVPLQQSQKKKRANQYVGTLDDHGTPFDPSAHCIDKDGLPKKRKDGYWQSKGKGGRPPGHPKTGGIQKGTPRVRTQKINAALEDMLLQSDTSLERFLKNLYVRYPDVFSKFLLKKMDHELAESSEGSGKTIVRRAMVVTPMELDALEQEIERIEALGRVTNRPIDLDIVDADYTEIEAYDKNKTSQELQEAVNSETDENGTTYDNEQ